MICAAYLGMLAAALPVAIAAGEFNPLFESLVMLQTRGEIKADPSMPVDTQEAWISEHEMKKQYTSEQLDALIKSGILLTRKRYRIVAKPQDCEGSDCDTPPFAAAGTKVVQNSSAAEADVERALRTDQAPIVGLPSAATTTPAPDTTSNAGTTAAPTPTSKPDCAETGTCSIYEDPHIKVFDGRQISLLGSWGTQNRALSDDDAGDMWLVKSSDISIQARYLPDPDLPEGNMFVRAVAVGGSFLDDNTLIIGSLDEETLWNDDPILEQQTGDFFATLAKGPLHARRHRDSHLVQDMTQTNAGVDIDFPLGVKLTVNRYQKHVNVHIEMPAAPGGQEGLCGNFNCNAADDAMQMILKDRDPKVLPEDELVSQ